jgi:hypothetical protein
MIKPWRKLRPTTTGLPGLKPVKKFESRDAAVTRIWAALSPEKPKMARNALGGANQGRRPRRLTSRILGHGEYWTGYADGGSRPGHDDAVGLAEGGLSGGPNGRFSLGYDALRHGKEVQKWSGYGSGGISLAYTLLHWNNDKGGA